MYLREEIIKRKNGPAILVHYCRDCESTEVETVQTCKKCGSHNIASPFSHKLDDYMNGVGMKIEYKEIKTKIYKCDLCGKEFDGLKTDNYLSYADGSFNGCNYKEFSDAEETNYNNYQLPVDLCEDCKKKLKTYLAVKLIDFTRDANIQKLIKEYLDKKKGI